MRKLGLFMVGIVIIGGAIGLRWADPAPIKTLRLKVFDIYQTISPRPVLENGPVNVVAIDEKSLKALGQWPWSRETMATLLEILADKGALVAFDIFFVEPDRQGDAVRPGLQKNDEIFASSLQKHTAVLSMGFSEERSQNDDHPIQPKLSIRTKKGARNGRD